jgi:hypothetical protein
LREIWHRDLESVDTMPLERSHSYLDLSLRVKTLLLDTICGLIKAIIK